MSLSDDARRHALTTPAAPDRPNVRIDSTGQGTAEIVAPADTDDFDALLATMLPEVAVDVVEVLEVRAWGNPEAPYKYVKCRVRRRLDGGRTGRELLAKIGRRRPRKQADRTDERTLVVALADPQIGKAYEAGGGTEETIVRVRSVIEQIPDHVDRLRRAGQPVSRIVLANMGDTTEGCYGHYDTQSWTTDLHESDQIAVALDLYDHAADTCARIVPDVICTVVNSNHDQPRTASGRSLTDPTDSRAFTIWRSLARAYSKAGDRYQHVRWHIPEDPLVSVLDLHGVGLAFVHGHQAKTGATAAQKLRTWWDGQKAGDLPAGHCAVLTAGHYHHYYAWEQQGRLLLGCPSLDGGSQWLTDRSGVWSAPGLLTYTVDENGPDNVRIIRP